jgi:GNAT superfamily N-acetyltransferase
MISIERRGPVGDQEVRQFCEIYEASFLPEERDDTAVVLAGVLGGGRDCYLAVAGGQVLGLAVVLPLAEYPVAFLEYLAVAPEARNAGIGGSILTRLREDLAEAAQPGTDGIIFEVDRPEDADGSGERELRRRRIAFYRRHGAVMVDGALDYRAPVPVGDGTLAYFLLWLPVAPETPPPTGADLKGCVTAMFTQSYELGEGTPLVRELVARVGG